MSLKPIDVIIEEENSDESPTASSANIAGQQQPSSSTQESDTKTVRVSPRVEFHVTPTTIPESKRDSIGSSESSARVSFRLYSFFSMC